MKWSVTDRFGGGATCPDWVAIAPPNYYTFVHAYAPKYTLFLFVYMDKAETYIYIILSWYNIRIVRLFSDIIHEKWEIVSI